jgi:hypothetical protein
VLGAHLVLAVKDGRFKLTPGGRLDVPGLGVITVLTDNVIYTQPDLTVFTRENIDEFQF